MEKQPKDRSVRRRGRPPSAPGISRNHRLVTFVNDAQYEQIVQLADEHEETLSMIVYNMLCKALSGEKQ